VLDEHRIVSRQSDKVVPNQTIAVVPNQTIVLTPWIAALEHPRATAGQRTQQHTQHECDHHQPRNERPDVVTEVGKDPVPTQRDRRRSDRESVHPALGIGHDPLEHERFLRSLTIAFAASLAPYAGSLWQRRVFAPVKKLSAAICPRFARRRR
jgi:hypothetical protein